MNFNPTENQMKFVDSRRDKMLIGGNQSGVSTALVLDAYDKMVDNKCNILFVGETNCIVRDVFQDRLVKLIGDGNYTASKRYGMLGAFEWLRLDLNGSTINFASAEAQSHAYQGCVYDHIIVDDAICGPSWVLALVLMAKERHATVSIGTHAVTDAQCNTIRFLRSMKMFEEFRSMFFDIDTRNILDDIAGMIKWMPIDEAQRRIFGI